MSALVLPTSPLYRTIGIDHWLHGLQNFNGHATVLVGHQSSGFSAHWTFTIEKIDDEIVCVTRLNKRIVSTKKASDLGK
jgi:hypothetical protein